MEIKKVDVAVLGGGPGGYPAAIYLANAGKKVALIEAKYVGGTCLNWGCIPTKALVTSVNLLRDIKNAESFGLHVSQAKADWPLMVAQKNEIVSGLRSSLDKLIRASGVEIIQGQGVLTSPKKIEVKGKTPTSMEADAIILATGSEPKDIKAFPFDGKFIHSSTTILDLESIPESILIIGAGAIGCEFASIFAALGSKVILVEALSRILPLECETISAAVAEGFKKDGIEILCGHTVEATKSLKDGIEVTLSDKRTLKVSCVLSAVGRRLNTDSFSAVPIKMEKGAVIVDEYLSTSVPGIWAIGDITGKMMLAHAATHQGITAARNILGEKVRMNYDAIPAATFTYPEVGSIGLTLEAAKKKGIKAKAYSYPFSALGRSLASRAPEGFAELVVEEDTGKIIGAQVVGHNACELIAIIGVALANEIPIECLADTIQAHPTFAEAWLEASLIACKTPLHFPKTLASKLTRG
jgi:dihydrolipoamide dehydrogenase